MASSPSLVADAKAKIFTLPPELIEQTLILAALYGFPSAIAHLSCTCRYFHQLVYCSTDNHLWREVFLTTFDDPRLVLGRIKSATTFSPGNVSKKGNGGCSRTGEAGFDWEHEFMRRMDAMRVMKKYKNQREEWYDTEMDSSHVENPSLSGALKSLLSVLETAHPFPAQRSRDAAEPAPTFPSIITAHASSFLPNEIVSSNALWVNRVIRFSCPPVLVNRFPATDRQRGRTRGEAGTLELGAIMWEGSEEAHLFNKLVFLNGFAPFSDVLSTTTSSLEQVPEQSPSRLAPARQVARCKVYNLRYLVQERCWGPFLPASGNGNTKEEIAVHMNDPDFEELSKGILGLGDVLDSNGQLVRIVDDSGAEGHMNKLTTPGEEFEDDGDYFPYDDDDSDSDNGVYDGDEIQRILINGQQPDPKFIPPKPHQVVPDYAYLSTARLLVEMNLREVLVMDNPLLEGSSQWNLELNKIVDAFGWLQFVRMGGAPGFWENWTVNLDGDEGEASQSNTEEEKHGENIIDLSGVSPGAEKAKGKEKVTGKGKGKAKDTEEYQGWDWAGAAGEWKRAVCWLDYRDLLLYNLTGFPSESLEETVRVFPMTLCISGYSPPPDPEPMSTSDTTSTGQPRSALESLVYTLPVIHLEGESRGSDGDWAVLRHVKGTVRMLADGAVRWTLTSSFPGDHVSEWVTESVQVGAIGSVVGIVGMWTGAEHAATDPLGPTWAWKVG